MAIDHKDVPGFQSSVTSLDRLLLETGSNWKLGGTTLQKFTEHASWSYTCIVSIMIFIEMMMTWHTRTQYNKEL